MTPAQLLAQAKESRTSWMTVEGKRFKVETLNRGSLERVLSQPSADTKMALLTRCVLDWQGFTEADISPNASDEPLPFQSDLLAEWCDVNTDARDRLFLDIWQACQKAYSRVEAAAEKPQP